jgi:hypothetical protein
MLKKNLKPEVAGRIVAYQATIHAATVVRNFDSKFLVLYFLRILL